MCPESNLVPALTSQRWVFWVLKLSWLQIQGKCSQASLQGCWEQLAPAGECHMDAPKCRSGYKTVRCSVPTMYWTSRARLSTQHKATLTTQQSPTPHTPQCHTHNSRAQLHTRRSATLTTRQRPARHTAQRHTHNSRARLCTHRSATHNTTEPGSTHAAAPHSQQQSPAPNTPQRHTHNTAETSLAHSTTLHSRHSWGSSLRPYLIKRCRSLPRVQCLLGINGCYMVWHPQREEYRILGIRSGGRTGPAYHHPWLPAWRISLPLLPCLGSIGLMALIPSGPSTRGHGLSPVTIVDSWALWVPCAKGPTCQKGMSPGIRRRLGDCHICRQGRIYLTPIFFRCLLVLLCMKCSLGILNFLEEISSLSHSVVFLHFFPLITEEGFISPCYSLELCI